MMLIVIEISMTGKYYLKSQVHSSSMSKYFNKYTTQNILTNYNSKNFPNSELDINLLKN